MRKQKHYFTLILLISILLGIIPPLALGVKDPMLIATTFSMVWVIYAIILLVTVFLVNPGTGERDVHAEHALQKFWEAWFLGDKD